MCYFLLTATLPLDYSHCCQIVYFMSHEKKQLSKLFIKNSDKLISKIELAQLQISELKKTLSEINEIELDNNVIKGQDLIMPSLSISTNKLSDNAL